MQNFPKLLAIFPKNRDYSLLGSKLGKGGSPCFLQNTDGPTKVAKLSKKSRIRD